MNNRSGIEFLTKIYNNLHNEEIVKHTANPSDNRYQSIEKYMNRLERITERAYQNENDINLLKRLYHDKYVIKEENVPESYFEKQEQIALDRGYGHVKYTDAIKGREIEQIRKEQEESLDSWLDYFASSDTKHYPTWFKYYCFQSVVKLGYYDKKSDKFTKRTDSTVKPFIEINREALAFIYDSFVKVLDKKELDDKDLEKLINNGSFAKIYSYAIKKMDSVQKDNTNSDDGIWKKYDQGSDPSILFNDIHGKGTGWCTAGGIETATSHIEGGDFYVYYTKDKNGEYTAPRIAIRMEYGKIAEIRGVAENQNLESNMEKVVDKKLDEFPDKEEYKKKVHDMEMLTYIYTKSKTGGALSKEDLRFLYEIDEEIVGFGYQKDPRIGEIIEDRNKREDLSFIFDCSLEQISFTKEEVLRGNIIYHYGDLYLGYSTIPEGLKLPETIGGNLNLSILISAEGLKLPETVKGYLDLGILTSAEGLKLPETIGGDLNLSGLTSAEGLKLPKTIDGNLYLNRLISAENLKLPETIGGDLDLSRLTSAEGLKLPETIGGDLYLSRLTSAEGLKLPETVKGYLDLGRLTSAEGLKLPETIGGDLDLRSLTSAEGLIISDELNCKIICPYALDDLNELRRKIKEDSEIKTIA